jgi:hypothetical protein
LKSTHFGRTCQTVLQEGRVEKGNCLVHLLMFK